MVLVVSTKKYATLEEGGFFSSPAKVRKRLGYWDKRNFLEGSMDEESLLEFFSEDYSLFVEAGFVAVKQLDEIAARRLFKAAEVLNPDNPASQLGLGYIALNKLHVTEAATIFEAILKKDPEHRLAQALLGVAYLLSQDKKKRGEQLILEAKDKCDDPTIKNLADVCLDWLQKDLGAKSLPPLKAPM